MRKSTNEIEWEPIIEEWMKWMRKIFDRKIRMKFNWKLSRIKWERKFIFPQRFSLTVLARSFNFTASLTFQFNSIFFDFDYFLEFFANSTNFSISFPNSIQIIRNYITFSEKIWNSIEIHEFHWLELKNHLNLFDEWNS